MLSTAVRNTARVSSRRPMSTAATPKIHKYKDAAPELMKTRPPPGHDHVSRTIVVRMSAASPLRRGLSLPERTLLGVI